LIEFFKILHPTQHSQSWSFWRCCFQTISRLVVRKLNLTQQTDRSSETQRYYNTKKLNAGVVASYDIWPGNGECTIF